MDRAQPGILEVLKATKTMRQESLDRFAAALGIVADVIAPPPDDFGRAYHELLDASDEVIDEIVRRLQAQTNASDRVRVKAARAIQQMRESERRRSR